MTWIKTVRMSEVGAADAELRAAYAAQSDLYPPEYGQASSNPVIADESIVASHSLIPGALLHAFATYGALMAPELPLTRRQHEMIATLVSVENRCFY
jgi:hypothetical protein